MYLLQLQGFVTQSDIDENCEGSGALGGADALQGMGILLKLLMAVLAVMAH